MMNLLDKNKFKITAFFRKIYFLDYANPTMAKISFNEEKLKQFIMNLDPNMKFIEYEEPNATLADELMIDEFSRKDPSEPDIEVNFQLFRNEENYFLKIIY